MTNRMIATTAIPEEVAAIEKFMRVFASSLEDGQSKEETYSGGRKFRVTKMGGRFHAAIDVAIVDIP